MSDSGSLLSTGVSGLLAFQQNLSSIGNNIANVNTEGYSRQVVEMASRNPNPGANGFLGRGVEVTTIKRVYDQFIFDQVTLRNSSYNQLDVMYGMASQVDELLASDDTGIDSVLQNFFNALQDVSSDPTSIPARIVLLSEAENLTSRFQVLNQNIDDLRQSVNSQIEAVTSEINSLASSIANINQIISQETGRAGGQPPNDLLDKRDAMINSLSEIISIKTVEGENGSTNVFIGNGQTLVLGFNSRSISATANIYDPTQLEISFITATSTFEISDQLNGGKLGGLLTFRDNVLDLTQNSLGALAIALSDTVNIQHQSGDDLNGNPGGLFFNNIISTSPQVLASVNNNTASGSINVTISDSSSIKGSDYNLSYDGTTFTLMRTVDNVVVDSGFTVAGFPRAIGSEGITLGLVGSMAAGDSFLIRPVRTASNNISVQLTNPEEFAAAASGNALGDNSNALSLVSMQSLILLDGGRTFQTAFAGLVAKIGILTRESKVNASAQEALLKRSIEAQQEVSGVNLDEEAANLIKFQQAYQAAAQLIRISNEIFQTLIQVTGR